MSPKDAMAPIGVRAKTAERLHATKSRLVKTYKNRLNSYIFLIGSGMIICAGEPEFRMYAWENASQEPPRFRSLERVDFCRLLFLDKIVIL
jgi:hypothetical protein